jgi:hypothetical protein
VQTGEPAPLCFEKLALPARGKKELIHDDISVHISNNKAS